MKKTIAGILFVLVVVGMASGGSDDADTTTDTTSTTTVDGRTTMTWPDGSTTTSWHNEQGGACSRSTDDTGAVRSATVCINPDGSVTDDTIGP